MYYPNYFINGNRVRLGPIRELGIGIPCILLFVNPSKNKWNSPKGCTFKLLLGHLRSHINTENVTILFQNLMASM